MHANILADHLIQDSSFNASSAFEIWQGTNELASKERGNIYGRFDESQRINLLSVCRTKSAQERGRQRSPCFYLFSLYAHRASALRLQKHICHIKDGFFIVSKTLLGKVLGTFSVSVMFVLWEINKAIRSVYSLWFSLFLIPYSL